MKHDNYLFCAQDGDIKVVTLSESASIILAMLEGELKGCTLTDHNNRLEVEIEMLRRQSK